jgi:hypothetical protein
MTAQAQAEASTAVLQDQVEELAEILPLDQFRLGEDIALFEDDNGVLYAVPADASTFGGVTEDAVVARIEAGKRLRVEQVDADEVNSQELSQLGSQGFVE